MSTFNNKNKFKNRPSSLGLALLGISLLVSPQNALGDSKGKDKSKEFRVKHRLEHYLKHRSKSGLKHRLESALAQNQSLLQEKQGLLEEKLSLEQEIASLSGQLQACQLPDEETIITYATGSPASIKIGYLRDRNTGGCIMKVHSVAFNGVELPLRGPGVFWSSPLASLNYKNVRVYSDNLGSSLEFQDVDYGVYAATHYVHAPQECASDNGVGGIEIMGLSEGEYFSIARVITRDQLPMIPEGYVRLNVSAYSIYSPSNVSLGLVVECGLVGISCD